MAFIETVPPPDADGALARLYDQAVARAGRVYKIVELMSPSPAVLQASLGFYVATVLGPSPLSRVEREAIAVTVSRANDCFY